MDMKKWLRVLSYVLVALAASAVTLGLTLLLGGGNPSKLDQLENLILDRFIGEPDRTAMEDAASEAMVASLGDRWSYYIPAGEYESYAEQMANAYVGIGVTVSATDTENGLQVLKVTPGSPASEAGILPGDVITAVDGHSAAELGADGIRDLIRGEEGTGVSLTVETDGTSRTVTVERRSIQTPVAVGTLLEDGTGLVTISNFDSRCFDETKAAVESLLDQGATALIFDVRNNPGGYKSELVKVLDYLLPAGPLFRSLDYTGREEVDESGDECVELPMAVLVNGSSYSAAEFFAAALREYGVAQIIGEPTVGKGYFQTTVRLRDGSAVGLSVGKYFTPNGVSLAEEGGLTPDVLVEVDDETAGLIASQLLDPMEDPQIAAALAVLGAGAEKVP